MNTCFNPIKVVRWTIHVEHGSPHAGKDAVEVRRVARPLRCRKTHYLGEPQQDRHELYRVGELRPWALATWVTQPANCPNAPASRLGADKVEGEGSAGKARH